MSVYECKGTTIIPGREKMHAKKNKKCEKITLIMNTPGPVCDISIHTVDKGGALIPAFLALNPNFEPTSISNSAKKGTFNKKTGKFTLSKTKIKLMPGKIDGEKKNINKCVFCHVYYGFYG